MYRADDRYDRIDYMPQLEEVYEALSELIFGEKGRPRPLTTTPQPRPQRVDHGREPGPSLPRVLTELG